MSKQTKPAADIRQIARLAGVSPSTVSRVLNDHPYVSATTRQRVKQVIEGENYHPNALAANLRRKVSDIVGYLQMGKPGLEDGRLAQMVEARLFSSGFRMFMCNADSDAEREDFYLEEMIRQRVAGAIVYSRGPESATEMQQVLNAAQRLSGSGIVTIVMGINAKSAGVSSIATDHEQGWRLGLAHLADLGHRHIAYLDAANFAAPMTGLLSDLAVQPPRQLARATARHAAPGMGEVLDRLLKGETRPTALLCATEEIAAEAVQHFLATGAKVPDDISILCFGGTDFGRMIYPRLTTISLPLDDLGELCSEQLVTLIGKRSAPARTILMENQLVAGDSTGPVGSSPVT